MSKKQSRYIDSNLAKAQFTGNFKDSYSPSEAKAMIDEVPTADVALVVHAHWEYQKGVFTDKGIKGCFECSACKATIDAETFDLMYECGQTRMCGSCGARMDEEATKDA